MTKGAIFIRKQGYDESRDATSPLEGYEYVGVVDGDMTWWTVLMAESEETRLRTFHRVYTWDYEKMKRTGSHECPVHPPTLILPSDIPNPERAISAWLDIDEGPGRDFAYVREDESDYLHVVSALDMSCGIGRYWMEHDL